MNNIQRKIDIYYKSEEATVYLEEYQGFYFIHIDINIWKPSVLKKIREGFRYFLDNANKLNIDLIFTTGEKDKIKLWNLIKPCDEVRQVPELENCWVGCWETDK